MENTSPSTPLSRVKVRGNGVGEYWGIQLTVKDQGDKYFIMTNKDSMLLICL